MMTRPKMACSCFWAAAATLLYLKCQWPEQNLGKHSSLQGAPVLEDVAIHQGKEALGIYFKCKGCCDVIIYPVMNPSRFILSNFFEKLPPSNTV